MPMGYAPGFLEVGLSGVSKFHYKGLLRMTLSNQRLTQEVNSELAAME